MYGGHYSKDVLTIPCGGGLWQFSNGTSLPTARQQETVFWKRMDVDTIRGSSEKSRCCFEVRLMTIQSGSAGRHEVRRSMSVCLLWRVSFVALWSTRGALL